MLSSIKEAFQNADASDEIGAFEVNGLRPWELIRFKVYSKIAKKQLGFGEAIAKNTVGGNSLKVLVAGIIGYSNTRKSNVDYLVFTHGRKTKVGMKEMDIIIDPFIEEALNRNEVIEKVETGISYDFSSGLNMNVVKLCSAMKRKFSPYKMSEEEIAFINRVASTFAQYEISVQELEAIYKNELIDFTIKTNYYRKILKKTNPKRIVHVVSYMNKPLIKVAQEFGIPTIELQHGLVNELHFGYNQVNSQYKPDELWMFGQYWIDNAGSVTETYAMSPKNFKYHTDQLNKYSEIPKNNKKILFISQGTIGRDLFECAKQLSHSLSDYEINYKLHPGEFLSYTTQYDLDNVPVNLRIIGREVELLSLQAESAYQVGVYSTALLEGIYLGCETFILDLQGAAYMENLLTKKQATLIKAPMPENLQIAIQDALHKENRKIDSGYIYCQ